VTPPFSARALAALILIASIPTSVWAETASAGHRAHQIPSSDIRLEPLTEVRVPEADARGSAEIMAYDTRRQTLLVVSAEGGVLERFHVRQDETALHLDDLGGINVWADLRAQDQPGAPRPSALTSVAYHAGQDLIAVSVTATKPDDGWVVVYHAEGPAYLGHRTIGSHPDMLTFSPDGRVLYVANEGEAAALGDSSPGSLAILQLPEDGEPLGQATLRQLYFSEDQVSRTAPPPRVSQGWSFRADMEPEYIALSPDGEQAFVTLQENNAIATVDLTQLRVTALWGLGAKDHRLPNQGLDVSDRDGGVNIRPWPLNSFYMPDGIAAYDHQGTTYLVTANEGDSRDLGGYQDTRRVGDLDCPEVPAADGERGPAQRAITNNRAEQNMGRLQVINVTGERCGTLTALGSRSFSIWDAEAQRRVFDSGDDFETLGARQGGRAFNDADRRSDQRGPEPEAVTLVTLQGRTYAFIALERSGFVVVYDITDPLRVQYLTMTQADPARHAGPESMVFLAPEYSPNGRPLLAVAYEYSGSVVVYEIQRQAPPGG